MSTKQEKKWSKQWPWALPCGCLGLILIAGGTILGIVFGVMQGIGSTDVCRQAVERAAAHPALVAEIGSPIKTGWLTRGSISFDGSSGDARLTVPISGPEGKAALYLEAEKHGGEWQYQLLEVVVESSGRQIDLLADPPLLESPAVDNFAKSKKAQLLSSS